MADRNEDESILGSINRLVNEEHHLWSTSGLDARGQARLDEIRVELDQCWDLLRQRDALREYGKNPDTAHVRPPSVVEKYEG
jgi:hypothetical protein